MALPVRLGVLRALVKEISASAEAGKPLVVGGARELAAVLRRELGRDAEPGAVRSDDDPRGGAMLVYVLVYLYAGDAFYGVVGLLFWFISGQVLAYDHLLRSRAGQSPLAQSGAAPP